MKKRMSSFTSSMARSRFWKTTAPG